MTCYRSASPKPHPSEPHPCNMPQAKTEVALQFSESCAAETALQHSLFCNAEVILTKSCAATSEKLHCDIEKAALQESGAFLPLSCWFQAPTFRHPRLGPAEQAPFSGLRPDMGKMAEKWILGPTSDMGERRPKHVTNGPKIAQTWGLGAIFLVLAPVWPKSISQPSFKGAQTMKCKL